MDGGGIFKWLQNFPMLPNFFKKSKEMFQGSQQWRNKEVMYEIWNPLIRKFSMKIKIFTGKTLFPFFPKYFFDSNLKIPLNSIFIR